MLEALPGHKVGEASAPSGYKRTEVGVIPNEWDLVPMHQLYSFRNGVNADRTAYGSGVPFVNVLEIVENSHLDVPQVPGKVTLPEAIRSKFDLRSGDVVFNRTSETQDEVGMAAAYTGTQTISFGGFVIRARPATTALDSVFAGYLLRESTVRRQVVQRGQGAIRANIGQSDLKTVLVPVPTLSEQRAISRALSDADELISALDRLIEKKRAIKLATMQQLLTGRVRLSGFDTAWNSTRLGLVGQCNRGVSYDPDQHLVDYGAEGTSALLRANNVRGGQLNVADVLYVRESTVKPHQRLRHGDILICMANGSRSLVGKAARVELMDAAGYTFGAFMAVYRSIDSRIDDAYLSYVFQSDAYYRALDLRLAGSSINNLKPSDLHEMEFDLPPLPEQRAIATVLLDKDAEIAALERRREKTNLIKQGMMQELLTGRIRLVDPTQGPPSE